MTVRTGLEGLREGDFRLLTGQRVGLMSNPSAVDQELRSTYDIFREAAAVDLVALFAPEHGFAAAAPDAEHIATTTDVRTGLPLYSLYGETRRPSVEMMNMVDIIVCDIQDVGVRYYTYIWTISHILEAAGKHGVSVVILDRPNPLGGHVISGPSLEPQLESFVGRFPVPVRHGLTVGELAQMINDNWNPTPAQITVVQCQGWQRAMMWNKTGLLFVPPSPNIPAFETVLHYPGACLVEGTQLSEGRGTALPFQVVGAPWLDASELADHLNAQDWPAVRFRPHTFQPTSSKWAGEYCQGVQAHIIDQEQWLPLTVWLGVVRQIRMFYPEQFEWLPPFGPGVESGPVYHFDRLIGSETVRHQIDTGVPLAEIMAGWDTICGEFDEKRQSFLLYD